MDNINLKQLSCIVAIILISSFLITQVDKSYDFIKLSGYLFFYYVLILLFSHLAKRYLQINNAKMICSSFGLFISLILWFMFGNNAKKGN